MPESTSLKRTPKDLLRLVLRRWRLFMVIASLVSILVLLGSHRLPRRFTGSTTFERRASVQAASLQASRSAIMETLRQDVIGRPALEQLIEELDLTAGLPRDSDHRLTEQGEMMKENILTNLANSLRMTRPVQSASVDHVTIHFTTPDRALAKDVPNMLVQKYIERVNVRRTGDLVRQKEFLQRQVTIQEQEMRLVNERLADFDRRYVMASSPAEMEMRIHRLEDITDALQRQLRDAEDRRAYLQARIERAAGQDPEGQPYEVHWGPNPDYRRIEEDLRAEKRRLERARLVERRTDEHPQVLAMMATIRMLEEELGQTPAEIPLTRVVRMIDPTEQYSLELMMVDSLIRDTSRDLELRRMEQERLRNTAANFAARRSEYEQLRQQHTEVRAAMRNWQDRLQGVEMQLQAAVQDEENRLTVVQPAADQYLPSDPAMMSVLVMALGGGIGFAAALVLLLNFLDATFTNTDEASRCLSVPILGVVGQITTRRERLRRRLGTLVMMPGVVSVLMLAIVVAALSVYISLRRPEAEFESFRVNPAAYMINQVSSTLD